MTSDYSTFWRRRETTGRRTVLRGALVGGLGLAGAALVGCSSSSGKPAATGAPAGAPGAAKTGEEKPVVSDAFVAVQTRDAPSLEPLDVQVYTVAERIGLVYPRLVYTDLSNPKDQASVRFIPSYAVEGWELTNGGTTVTFKLTKGLKYQNIAPLNGRAFTSADVKYSVNRYMTHPRSTFQSRYDDVAAIETPDANTVVFKLKRPSRYFISALATESAFMTPPELGDGDAMKQTAIGPGPFIHKEYLQKEGSNLVKNPDFIHADKIYYNKFLFKVMTDAATRQAATKSGQVDFGIGGVAKAILPTVEGPNVTSYPVSSTSSASVAWNMKNPKFADIRLRMAMSKVINRQEYMDSILSGEAKFNGVVQVDFGRWALSEAENRKINAFTFDPAEAKKLWDAAGAPAGFKTEFYFWSVSPSGEIQATYYKDAWKKYLGIDTSLRTEDYSITVPTTYQGKYPEMSSLGFGVPNWMDHIILQYTVGGSRNGTHFGERNDPNEAKAIEMIAQLRAALDDNVAEAKSKEIQHWITDKCLTNAQLPTATSIGVYNSKLRNFIPGGYPPGMEWMLGSWKAK